MPFQHPPLDQPPPRQTSDRVHNTVIYLFVAALFATPIVTVYCAAPPREATTWEEFHRMNASY